MVIAPGSFDNDDGNSLTFQILGLIDLVTGLIHRQLIRYLSDLMLTRMLIGSSTLNIVETQQAGRDLLLMFRVK